MSKRHTGPCLRCGTLVDRRKRFICCDCKQANVQACTGSMITFAMELAPQGLRPYEISQHDDRS